MKHNMKYMFSLMFVLLFAQGAWADETATGQTVTIIKQLNGAAVTTTSPGEVTSEIEDGVCTLTVTPASGRYVTKDNITAYSVVSGNVAQAPRRRSPSIDNDPIEIRNAADNTDPTGVTSYELTMPADGSDVEVTVDFQSYQMYSLYIGNTQVTELNAGAIQNADTEYISVAEGGSVTFDVETSTLTLDNATLKHGIISSLANLTIQFKGTNKINTDGQSSTYSVQQAAPNNAISTTVGTATLTFKKDGNSSVELFGKTTAYYSVISGFASISYSSGDSQCYLHTSAPSYYDATDKNLANNYDGGSITNATVSGETSYPLWLINSSDQGTQVTSTNVTASVIAKGTVTFSPSNNTLSLNGVEMEGKIMSGLGNLTIDITGANYIATEDSGSVVRSVNAGTLTIKKTGDNASLKLTCADDMNSFPVIQGFKALNYDGLNLDAEDGATYGEYIVYDYEGDEEDEKLYGLYNPNKTEGYDKRITSATFTTAELYPLWIGGTRVTSDNASNVLGNNTVSFDVENNILTLNGATINGGVVSNLEGGLTVHLVGANTIDGGYESEELNGEYAFRSGVEEVTLTFTTDDATPGQLLLKNQYRNANGYAQYYDDNWSRDYQNGLVEGYSSDEKHLIAKAPVVTPASGLYWPDQTYTITGNGNGAIKYSDGMNHFSETTYEAPFTMATAGSYLLSVTQTVACDESSFTIGNGGEVYIVHNKPGFSVEAGTHNGAQNITLTNLPADLSADENGYPQVWYYLDDNDENPVRYTSAEQEIAVTASTKVCVFILDEDSGKVVKSDTVQAEYVILQEPGYHFSTSESGQSYYSTGSTVYNLYYGEENTLPWLINVPDGMAITYASEDENVATIDQTGLITLTGAGHVWITASNAATDEYQAHTERIRLEIKPTDPQVSLAEGVYFTGQKLTLTPTVPNGTIYYSYGYNGEKMEYTDGEEIELPEGTYDFYTYTRCVTEADDSDTDYMQSYGNNHRYYYVFDVPVISKDAGTYNGPLEVDITELPENASASAYYYFDNDEEHATQYDAENKITVTASKTLKVYLFVEGDSGKTYKSEVIEREYTIRQDAGLAYLQNGEQVVVAVYTIGGADNLELPTLQNENELAITYSSSNTAVATVNNEGEVTIVGIGETTITATSAQTEDLMAGEASYPLTVLKDLSYESITVTVADATYNMGEDVEPEVTVMDGDTDITEYVMVEYANNTQVGSQATVTITPSDDLDVNYYVGSTSATFTISNRTLTVGEDMSFASGQTWATYYNTEESLNLPAGVAAYVVTSIEGNTLNLRALNYVPKNVPVLLNQTNEAVVGYNDFDNNELIGTVQATAVSSINDGTVYVLYNGMFVKSTSGNIPANRAYLVLGAAYNGPEAPSFLLFNIESTGMQMVVSDSSAEGNWYDLNGRKLSAKPTAKGLYIHNGKKKVVK